MLADALFLAVRYLRAWPSRTAVLIVGAAVALFLPLFTWAAGQRIEGSLLERARSTPIVIGAKGNEFDLTMSSLYFRGQVGEPIRYHERLELESRDYGVVVPLLVRHSAGGVPVVGTSLEYFEARGLELTSGRRPALLGEVVVGAAVAEETGLAVGDTVRSDLTNLYNLAGAYPSLLEVVGVLAATGGPDDEALFADVKTTWLLEGRIHGHDEVSQDQAISDAGDESDNLEASAAIFLFHRITAENRNSFHLHGGQEDSPLSSLLVFPKDARAHDQLLGDFSLSSDRQALRPLSVVRTVLGIVLRLQEALAAYFGLVALSTVSFLALVLVLSLRLRSPELRLMQRLGCARGTIAVMVGAETLLISLGALAVAGAGCGLSLWYLGRWI